MKHYTILKNLHYSTFIPKLCIFKDNFEISQVCKFDESCKYIISEDSCVNKLFGFSFGLFGVHKNSIRYGWLYNNEENKFFIYRYCYIDGKLNKHIIFDCNVNEYHIYKISITKDLCGQYHIHFIIDEIEKYTYKINKVTNKLLLTLGFYFGGNTRAPHTMKLMYV